MFRIRHSDSRFVIVSGTQLPKVRRILKDVPAVEKVIVLDDMAEYQEKEMPMSEVIRLGDQFVRIIRALSRPDTNLSSLMIMRISAIRQERLLILREFF